MRGLALACAASCLLVWGARVRPVQAQKQDRSCTKQLERTQARGLELLDKRDYKAALAKLQEAQRCSPDPYLEIPIAQALEGLGRDGEALRHYMRFLAAPKMPRKAVKKVWARVQALRAQVASIALYVWPAGTTVHIGGAEIGKAPFAGEVFLDPGRHKFRFSLAGHEAQERKIAVEAGDTVDLKIVLSELPRRRSTRAPHRR